MSESIDVYPTGTRVLRITLEKVELSDAILMFNEYGKVFRLEITSYDAGTKRLVFTLDPGGRK